MYTYICEIYARIINCSFGSSYHYIMWEKKIFEEIEIQLSIIMFSFQS